MKESYRTIALVVLLVVSLLFIVWMRHNYDTSFLQSLR